MQQKSIIKLLLNIYLGMALFLIISCILPASAQVPRPDEVAVRVYQTLPHIPLENQYISQETGEIAENNTLLSRLLRYHQYVKNRPLNYRLDWQLTFADYLEANEIILERRYPGNQTLKDNPLTNDRIAIGKLTRLQRNKLIETLLAIYSPNTPTLPQTPSTSTAESNRNQLPQLPKPGDVELLMP